MITVNSPHPPGTVAYIAANNPRYGAFFDSIEQLRVPLGSVLAKSILYNAARNRNEVANIMMGEWILFLDDDNVFDSQLLLSMLDRKVDIVAAPYPRRYPPFETVSFPCYHPETMACQRTDKPHIWTLNAWDDFSGKMGLIETGATGFGAVLVRKKVLKAMEEKFGMPYFRVGKYDNTWVDEAFVKDEMQEDLSFCWAARKCGFKVYIDLDLAVGHMTEVKLAPLRDKDGRLRVISYIDGFCQWVTK